MVIDAFSHVCPERLLDAIGERHPGDGVATLRKNSYLYHDTARSLGPGGAEPEQVLGGNVRRILRLL